MIEFIETFMSYWQFSFVRNAFVVGTFIALCSSLFGVTLVLRRFSFIGDGLSHVAFGAMTIATAFNFVNKMSNANSFNSQTTRAVANTGSGVIVDMPFVLIVTIICAIFLLKYSQKIKIKGDAQLAIISVGALAIGYLIMNRFTTSSNISADVCSTLFGSASILTIPDKVVYLSVVLSIIVIIAFILLYNKIFAITFDENFAISSGVNANFYNLILAIIIAIIIVISMNLVGSLLVSALIIFPALSSMRVFKTFKSVTICSAIYSVVCSLLGLSLSVVAGTPVGSTIVFVDIIAFIIFSIIGYIKGGIKI